MRALGIMGRTASMIAGALTLLLVLGLADPGNRRLMPSFFSSDPLPGVLPRGSVDETALLRTIGQFNEAVASAYRTLDAAGLGKSPLGANLRRAVAEEIAFLKREGRVLEMTVRDIRIVELRRLANQNLSVNTAESVRLRELDAASRREIKAQVETLYAINYTLERSGDAWRIVALETLSVGARDE